MNEGSENDHGLTWESLFNLNDQLFGSEEKFEDDKLLDPNRSDTCQPLKAVKEMVEASTDVGKKMSPPNSKKDGNKSGEPKSGADGGGGRGGSEHEIHIWTERERRKKMRNMFENLHALLPQLPAKADKSTIVDEAVKHIKMLQNTFNKLQNQKIERLYGIVRLSTMNNAMMTTQKLPSVGTSWEQFLADQGSTSNSTAITPTTNNNNTSASPLLMNINNNIPTDFQTWNSPNVTLNVSGAEAHISVCCPKKPGLFSLICHVLEKHNIEIVSSQINSNHVRSMFMIQAQAKGGSGLAQFSEGFSVEEMYKQAATEILSLATSK